MGSRELPFVDDSIAFICRVLPKMERERKNRSLSLLIDTILQLPTAWNIRTYFYRLFLGIAQEGSEMTKEAFEYYKAMGLSAEEINPGPLKSNTYDPLFELSSQLLEKMLNCPPEWIDSDHQL